MLTFLGQICPDKISDFICLVMSYYILYQFTVLIFSFLPAMAIEHNIKITYKHTYYHGNHSAMSTYRQKYKNTNFAPQCVSMN